MDPSCGTAVTFVDVEYLERASLDHILKKYPEDQKLVRKAQIRLAICRAILKALKKDDLFNPKGKGITSPIREKKHESIAMAHTLAPFTLTDFHRKSSSGSTQSQNEIQLSTCMKSPMGRV